MPSLKFILLNRNQQNTDLFTSCIKNATNLKITNNIDAIETHDIIIANPDQLEEISEQYPDLAFRLIDILANCDDINTPECYKTHDENRKNGKFNFTNIPGCHEIHTTEHLNEWVRFLSSEMLALERSSQIIKEIKMINCINIDPSTDKNLLVTEDFKKIPVSDAVLAETAFMSDEGLARLVREWLRLRHSSFTAINTYEFTFRHTCGVLAEAVDELNIRLRPAGVCISENDIIKNHISDNGFEGDRVFIFRKTVYTNDLYSFTTALNDEHIDYELKQIKTF